MKLAIPRFGEMVAPCFEYSATITIVELDGKRELHRTNFSLRSTVEYDRVRLLRDQAVDTLICGGMTQHFEDIIKTHGIQVISWVEGPVEQILALFHRRQLRPSMVVNKKLRTQTRNDPA